MRTKEEVQEEAEERSDGKRKAGFPVKGATRSSPTSTRRSRHMRGVKWNVVASSQVPCTKRSNRSSRISLRPSPDQNPTTTVNGFGKTTEADNGIGSTERCAAAEVNASQLLALVIHGTRYE